MASEVKVPLAGKMSKKALVFVLGGSAAVLAFIWYRHRSSAAASTAASTDTTATDTSAYDPSAIDPATGVPYADEYGGSVDTGIDPSTGIPYSQELGGGYYDPNTGQYVYPGSGGIGTSPGGIATGPVATITTNAEWAQAAESYLDGVGVDPTTLSAALGKYLTGQAVTPAQVGLIDQAIAAQGYPPVSGPNGFPPAVQNQPPTGQGGGGTGGGVTGGGTAAKVTVPNVVGERANTAITKLKSIGLGFRSTTGDRNPAHEYVVASQSPHSGSRATKGSAVSLAFREIK